MLNCNSVDTSRDMCENNRQFSRKYHPDKWIEQCKFNDIEGENIFKNISSAYEMLNNR